MNNRSHRHNKSVLFQILVLVTVGLTVISCDSTQKPKLVSDKNSSDPNLSKPSAKAAVGEFVATGLLVGSWSDQILKLSLGIKANDPGKDRSSTLENENCLTSSKSAGGEILFQLSNSCANSEMVLSGNGRIQVTKDLAGLVQSIQMKTGSANGDLAENEFIFNSDRGIFQNLGSVAVNVSLKRINAFLFSFSEDVRLKFNRNPKESPESTVAVVLDVRRSGFIQVNSSSSETSMSVSSFQINTDMRNQFNRKAKIFSSVLNLLPRTAEQNSFELQCGIPQGEFAFTSVTNNDETEMSIDGVVSIRGGVIVDAASGRRFNANALCDRMVTSRLASLEKILTKKITDYFGRVREKPKKRSNRTDFTEPRGPNKQTPSNRED